MTDPFKDKTSTSLGPLTSLAEGKKRRPKVTLYIRGFGWFSLLKLIFIGYFFGTLPFLFLLSFASIVSPGILTKEIMNVVGLPGVLITWPVASLCAAWVTNFIFSVGFSIFCAFRSLSLTIIKDGLNKEG
jgi:hypothetical protein